MSPRLLRPVGQFDPRRLSNLAYWLDAADASTLAQNDNGTTASGVGDAVGYWADKSGNGRNVTQDTANSRPVRVAFAGRHALDFDGSNDALNNFALPAIGAANLTYFQVVSPDVINAFRSPSQVGVGTAANATVSAGSALLVSTNGTTGDGTFVYGRLGGNFIETTAPALAATATGLLTFRRSSTTAASARLNRQATTPATGNPTDMSIIAGFRVGGARSVTTNIQFWDGKICELILYTRALSDAEVLSVERYLANKWGVA